MHRSIERLYSADQVRELDRRAIEDHGIAGYTLMERAGAAAFRLLCLRWPEARRVAVYCGGGNNGGDGLVIARLARAAGLDVRVALAGDPDRLGGSARRAWDDFVATGGSAEALDGPEPAAADVCVDALLGTGLDRPVKGAIGAVIGRLRAGTAVLALDIPSGLQADTGAVMGNAVRADATITFIGAKRGLFTGAGPDWTGPVFLDDLDTPEAIHRDDDGPVWPIGAAQIAAALVPLRPCAHKGDRGRVLVVGGDHGFAGAARMAGEAALHGGAGLVTIATRAEHAPAIAAARPELMARGLEDPDTQLPALLDSADAVVAGPGLGRGEWGRAVLAALAEHGGGPLLLDADGLNLLAEARGGTPLPAVITPHPGEAARLLGSDAATVQADRFAALDALRERYGCAVVLKAPGTLVAEPGGFVAMRPGGCPALSVGGAGDVLSGLVGALLGRGLPPAAAARTGVGLHAEAAGSSAPGGGGPVLPGELARAVAGRLARAGAHG